MPAHSSFLAVPRQGPDTSRAAWGHLLSWIDLVLYVFVLEVFNTTLHNIQYWNLLAILYKEKGLKPPALIHTAMSQKLYNFELLQMLSSTSHLPYVCCPGRKWAVVLSVHIVPGIPGCYLWSLTNEDTVLKAYTSSMLGRLRNDTGALEEQEILTCRRATLHRVGSHDMVYCLLQ